MILSREGIAQGCTLSMNLYRVALLPLLKRMHEAVPDALAPAYADDTAAAGKAVHNVACLSYLFCHGPGYGYFPDPGKSWYICEAEDKAVA
jgi:mono/diheme cytochrome c family protein